MNAHVCPHPQSGATMIEVLVTVIVLAVGILGLMGLQGRMQISEMESYQRSQALVLLNDMSNRLSTNRHNAASYVTGYDNPVGTGHNCSTDDTSPRHARDLCEWSQALVGVAETAGTSKVGAFIGGRGCIEDLGDSAYLITVVWQGIGPIATPPASLRCGQNLYNGSSGSPCQNDLCRRTVTNIVRFASLS